MADNATINPNTGMAATTVVALDEVTDGTLGTCKVQYVKLMDGTLDSTNKLLVNSLGEAAVFNPDFTGSGSLTAANQAVAFTGLNEAATLTFQLTGTWVGAVVVEVSLDNTNFVAVSAINVNTGTLSQSITVNGIYQAEVSAFSNVRVRCSAFTSGTIVATARIANTCTMVSLESPPPAPADYLASGSLAAVNAAATTASMNNAGTATFQITGTFVGTLTWEVSQDNTTFVAVNAVGLVNGANQATTTTVGAFQCNVAGFAFFRVRMTAFTSGAAVVSIRVSQSVGIIGTEASIAVTGNPTAAVLADAATNPTTHLKGALGLLFNGTTWDRNRNNSNATTGDTGAKTANFNGATQINYNARGAIITLLIGAVTGTITTFQTFLQWSPDGGTTWINYTPLGANITAPVSGNTISWLVYPCNWSVAGATPAALANGATQANFINAPLPRSWRFNANIAGTTPSITFTSVQINHIL